MKRNGNGNGCPGAERLDWVYRSTYFVRDRLLAEMVRGEALSLIGVYADSGFGKTTLIHSLLKETGRKAVWFNLENVSSFDAGFVHALRRELRRKLLGGEDGPPEDFGDYDEEIRRLARDLAACERRGEKAHIVIDNFHLAENDDRLNNLVDQILAADLRVAQLVILSRAHPYRSFLGLKARGRYLELGPDDLRFNEAETAGFFNEYSALDLEPHELRIIRGRLDGWAAGYMLARDYMKRRRLRIERGEFWGSFNAGLLDVFSYLNREVYHAETRGVQDFMRRSCLMMEMDADVLDRFLGTDDARVVLAELGRRHKFTERTGDRAWKYYGLFRRFLYLKTWEEDPAAARAGHRRLAEIFHEREDYASAFAHALAGEAYEYAAALVAEAARQDDSLGFVNLVSGYIEELSPVLRFTDTTLFLTICLPGRLLSEFLIPLTEHIAMAESRDDVERLINVELRAATIHYVLGNLDKAMSGYLRVKANAERIGDHHSLAFCDVMLADCHAFTGRAKEALRHGRLALHAIKNRGLAKLRGHALENMANAHMDAGDFAAAEACLEREEKEVAGCAYMEFWLNASRCRLLREQGRTEEGMSFGRRALEYAEANGLDYDIAHAGLRLAMCALRAGDHQSAESLLDRAYAAAAPYRYLLHTVVLYQLKLYAETGRPDLAEAKRAELALIREKSGCARLTNEAGIREEAFIVPPPADDRLKIRALGSLELSRAGERIAINRKAGITLLQYLIVNRGRFVNRDEIIEEIFPERSRNVNHFNVTLSALRAALGRDAVIREDDRYRLDMSAVDLDLDAFYAAAAERRGADNLEDLLRAEALCRGEFMAEFPYVDFLDPEREKCRMVRRRLLLRIARLCAREHDTSRSAEHYEKLLSADPFDEEAWLEYISAMLDWRAVYQARSAAKKMMKRFSEELDIDAREAIEELFRNHRLIL